jgi:hypothetical protein
MEKAGERRELSRRGRHEIGTALHVPTKRQSFAISHLRRLSAFRQALCLPGLLVHGDNPQSGRRCIATPGTILTTNRYLAVADRGQRQRYMITPTHGHCGVLRLERRR